MKCDICHKREWRLIFFIDAIERGTHGILLNQHLHLCFECLSALVGYITKQMDIHKAMDKNNSNAILAIPCAKQKFVKMGKISKDEMFNILKKISSIKNIKDFGRINENNI